MNKRCKTCGNIKSINEFYRKKSKTGKIYIRGTCKSCHIKRASIDSKKRRSIDNGDSRYYWDIKKKYGISKEEYLFLLEKQNSKCAICHLESKNRLCVDHDHKTNKVRGLLCHKCNRMLGIVNDNIEIIKEVLKYLTSYKNI